MGINLDRDDYLYRGFMPEIYGSALSPTTMYSNYYQTYVERDIRQFAAIRNLLAFETFIRLLAGRIGQIVNLSDLAVDLLVEGFERLVPVEIKASRTFSPDFCRSLDKLRSLNSKITPGLIIYAGERGLDYQGNRVASFMDTERAIAESLAWAPLQPSAISPRKAARLSLHSGGLRPKVASIFSFERTE